MPLKRFWRFIHRSLSGSNNNKHETICPIEGDATALPPVSTLQLSTADYQHWIHQQAATDLTEITAFAQLQDTPRFHFFMPVANGINTQTITTIESLFKQSYPHWQLSLLTENVDVIRLATESTLIQTLLDEQKIKFTSTLHSDTQHTTNTFFGVLCAHGKLAEHALYQFAHVIHTTQHSDFLYCDEDFISMNGLRHSPNFKPSFSPDLLDSHSYIGQLAVFNDTLLSYIEPDQPCGLHAHTIALLAHRADYVQHIPRVLYHQYDTPDQEIDEQTCWQQGLLDRQNRCDHDITTGLIKHSYRVRPTVHNTPLVSIIIPFKDKADLLLDCVNSLFKHTDYPALEVIGISNNSTESDTLRAIEQLQAKHPHFQVVEKNIPFNFSALCNFGVARAQGEFVVLLNNDINITSSDWVGTLLEHAQRATIGAVGATLRFLDGRIQHAGIVAGMHGLAGHSHLYFDGDDSGYQNSLMLNRNVSAVTGALLMVSKQKYQEVGGLDEHNLAVAYNDVDLCFKLLNAGYHNMVTPYCHAIHHESATRGYEDTPEKIARLTKEQDFFVDKWKTLLAKGDGYFSPHFDLQRHDFKIKLDD